MQRGGWHAPSNLLPLIILFAVAGIKDFISYIGVSKKWLYFLAIFVFIYFVGGNVKRYKDIIVANSVDLYKQVAADIVEYFSSQKISSPKIMVNDSPIIWYYTNYNLIQIPFDKDIDSLKKAIRYYEPNYLILTGYYPVSTRRIYMGEETDESLLLVYSKKYPFQIPVTDGNGGYELKIYKILYDKL
ncbi:MAG: hypothetical protein ABDH23_00990 [Endomicrobiia bacterium]